jgi:hypothetical protein
MSNNARFCVFLALLGESSVIAEPIQVAPANPQDYSCQGKPILLINWI